MRDVALRRLGKETGCRVLEGSAEATRLPNHSVDIITAGQAFHWFEPVSAKREFRRILNSNGFVVLVWNTRTDAKDGMNYEYERLIKRYSKDYHASGIGSTDQKTIMNFYNGKYKLYKIQNFQKLNLEGLLGRYLSASYSISERDPSYGEMRRDFEEVFMKYQKNGEVIIEYETEVFIGTVE